MLLCWKFQPFTILVERHSHTFLSYDSNTRFPLVGALDMEDVVGGIQHS